MLATVPTPVFEAAAGPRLRAEVGEDYLERLRWIEYHAALCLVLEIDRSFSPFYWTNMADADMPFVGLIEQANLSGIERYGGRHFLYVANYVPEGDPLLDMTADGCSSTTSPGFGG